MASRWRLGKRGRAAPFLLIYPLRTDNGLLAPVGRRQAQTLPNPPDITTTKGTPVRAGGAHRCAPFGRIHDGGDGRRTAREYAGPVGIALATSSARRPSARRRSRRRATGGWRRSWPPASGCAKRVMPSNPVIRKLSSGATGATGVQAARRNPGEVAARRELAAGVRMRQERSARVSPPLLRRIASGGCWRGDLAVRPHPPRKVSLATATGALGIR
jgi:hypothetical protein